MRLLITGSGFFARSLCETAARLGHEVVGIGRSAIAEWTGKYFQRSLLSPFDGIIRDVEPAAVVHFAGPSSVRSSFQSPLKHLESDVLTWANTLDSVRRSNLKPVVVFSSSAAVYGNPGHLPVNEDAVVAPISPYGFHKAACEMLGREYAECFNLDIVVARFFSTFGAGQQRLLIWELFQQLADDEGRTVELEGTGLESRDYLEVSDAMRATLEIVENRIHAAADGANSREKPLIVNVASGVERSVLEVAFHLRNLVAPEKDIRCRGEERSGDPRTWCADTRRLHSLAPSWQPAPFHLALSQCVAAWQKSHSRV